jgi:hypothetical protein
VATSVGLAIQEEVQSMHRDALSRVKPGAVVAALSVILTLVLAGGVAAQPTGEQDAVALEQRLAQLWAAAEKSGALGQYQGATGEYVVVVPGSSASSFPAESVVDLGLDIRIESSPMEPSDVTEIMARLTQRGWHPDAPNAAFGAYFDPRLGHIVVEGSSPASVFAPLQDEFPGLITYRMTDVQRDSRQSDSIPHKGGAAITNGGTTCSSGFTVKKSGVLYMVTAGHCFSHGTAVWSPGNGSPFGSVVNRAPFPARDLELLGGSNYTSGIYVGNLTGVVKSVTGAANPTLAFSNYCRSGQTTAESCGHSVTNLNGSFCDAAGCTNGVAVYSGGPTSSSGDSGAPFYLPGSSVQIRGMHFARSGSTMYAEKWTTISNQFGVAIHTP